MDKTLIIAIFLVAAPGLAAQGMQAELTDDYLVVDSNSARSEVPNGCSASKTAV